jgi:hypothetical protein
VPVSGEDDVLRVAGEAACLLEDLGFHAVARKKEGQVTLEFWSVADRGQIGMRRLVDHTDTSAERLANECARAFRARESLH